MPMIIGLTGPNAAGKGEAGQYLKEKGFTYLSLSDMIREEAARRKLPDMRETLIQLGNELRKTKGFGVLAAMANERIKDIKGRVVVDSIRSPYEVEELRKTKGFILLGIDAPVEARFRRAKARGRAENASTLEAFKDMEAKENTTKKGAQQLTETFALADIIIKNDGSLEDLHSRIDRFIEEAEANQDG